MFSYDQQSLALNKYFTAGKLTAWSIIHNGPGPRCINAALFQMMCGERPDLISFNLDLFMEEEGQKNMRKVN